MRRKSKWENSSSSPYKIFSLWIFIVPLSVGDIEPLENKCETHLECQNVRSVLRAVEKTFAQTEVMYEKNRIIVVMSKSSFFLRSKKGEF